MPTAEIPDRLVAQTDTAQTTAYTQYVQLISTSQQRRWWEPDQNGWSGEPQALTGASSISAAFDRTVSNDQYLKACQADEVDARLADRMISKLAVDYLACMERAYRAQHSSSVRCRVHSAARRLGHSSNDGPYGSFVSHLADLLSLGYASPRAPGN